MMAILIYLTVFNEMAISMAMSVFPDMQVFDSHLLKANRIQSK